MLGAITAYARAASRALAAKGHKFRATPRGIALVFAAELRPEGTRVGVADVRSGGAAAAY